MTGTGPQLAYEVLALPIADQLTPDLVMVMGFDGLGPP